MTHLTCGLWANSIFTGPLPINSHLGSVQDRLDLAVLASQPSRFDQAVSQPMNPQTIPFARLFRRSDQLDLYATHQPSNINLRQRFEFSDKGCNLAIASREGLEVPAFRILESSVLKSTDDELASSRIKQIITNLEQTTGTKLGDPDKPLLFSIRAGLGEYLPGSLPTYTQIGVTRQTLPYLIKKYGTQNAHRIYQRNLFTLADALKIKIDKTESIEELEVIIKKSMPGLLNNILLQIDVCLRAIRDFVEVNKSQIRDMLHKPGSYLNYDALDELISPAIIFQQMVYGVSHKGSVGVFNPRDLETGNGGRLLLLQHGFGEQVMTEGADYENIHFDDPNSLNDELKAFKNPELWHKITVLEKIFKGPITFEFVIDENGKLHILQVNAATPTGPAAFLIAQKMRNENVLSPRDSVEIIKEYHKQQVRRPRPVGGVITDLPVLGKGTSVLPRSAASGILCFTEEEIKHAIKTKQPFIIFETQQTPVRQDLKNQAAGILMSHKGGLHQIQLSRSRGIPTLVDVQGLKVIKNHDKTFQLQADSNGHGKITAGSWITISSKHGTIYLGKPKYVHSILDRMIRAKSVSEQEKTKWKPIFDAYQEHETISKELGLFTGDWRDTRAFWKKDKEFIGSFIQWAEENTYTVYRWFVDAQMGDHVGGLDKILFALPSRLIAAILHMYYQDVMSEKEKTNVGRWAFGWIFTHLTQLDTGFSKNIDEMKERVALLNQFSHTEISFFINQAALRARYEELTQNAGQHKGNKEIRTQCMLAGLGVWYDKTGLSIQEVDRGPLSTRELYAIDQTHGFRIKWFENRLPLAIWKHKKDLRLLLATRHNLSRVLALFEQSNIPGTSYIPQEIIPYLRKLANWPETIKTLTIYEQIRINETLNAL